MTQIPAPAPGSLASVIGGLFRKKPKAATAHINPRTNAAPPPRPTTPDDLQAWPWFPIHDTEEERFGPLTPHATTRDNGGWHLELGRGGLRVNGNTDLANAINIGGAIDQLAPGTRITAELDLHAMGEDGSLAALIVAAYSFDRLLMGVLNNGDIIVFTMHGTDVKIIGTSTFPMHPSGTASRLTLQAMLFEDSAILFANGQYIGTVTDAELIGQSTGAGFQAKGHTDVTLERFTVDRIRVGGA